MSAFFGLLFAEPVDLDPTVWREVWGVPLRGDRGASCFLARPGVLLGQWGEDGQVQGPLSNESRRWWAVGRGRIDNHPELVRSLRKRGHLFQTDSSFETLVHLSEEPSLEWELGLRGEFSFGVWDDHRKNLRLARDRLGIRPLFWSGDGAGLAFASDLTTLRRGLLAQGRSQDRLPASAVTGLMRPEGWRIRPGALGDYLDTLCIPGPETLFHGVASLLPAQRLAWQPGRVPTLETYWRPSYSPKRSLRREAALADFESAFEQSVALQIGSGGSTAVLLSGGPGSVSVAAEAASHLGSRLETYTVGFDETGYSEFEPSRRIAHFLGTDHHVIQTGPVRPEDLLEFARRLDQPLGDLEAWRDGMLVRAAGRPEGVLLSGHGCSEVWGGHPVYSMANASRWFPKRGRGRVGNPVVPQRACETRLDWADCFLAPETVYRRVRHLDPNGDLRHRLMGDLGGTAVGADREVCIEDLSHHDRMLAWDAAGYLPFRLLPRLEAVSRLHSVEVRTPWLDAPLFETLAHYPAETKISGGISAWLLRLACARGTRWRPPVVLPSERKTPFHLPVERWLKTVLAQAFEEGPLAHDSRLGEFFDQREMRAAFETHRAGVRRLDRLLWGLLVLEFWLRQSARGL